MTVRCLTLVLILVCSAVLRAEEPQPGIQVERVLELPEGDRVEYLFYLPEDYDTDEKPRPLMLFLHGRGESRGPLSLVAKWGPPRMVQQGGKLPYILVSPQCPNDDRWAAPTQQAKILQLLDYVEANFRVDRRRVYLTGLSMGGYGTWRLAADHPKRFAAAAPMCGGGDPKDAERLKDVPIWIFHGDQDRAVPFSKSVEMVQAIRQAGGTQVTFTSLEGIGHNCWSAAYATPALYAWFDRHPSAAARAASSSTPVGAGHDRPAATPLRP